MKNTQAASADNLPSPIRNRQTTAAAEVVYYPQTAGHLTPEKLKEVFATVGRHDPLWQALMQLLQQRLANATVAAAAREENAPGRIEELIDFQRELSSWRDLAASAPVRRKVRAN